MSRSTLFLLQLQKTFGLRQGWIAGQEANGKARHGWRLAGTTAALLRNGWAKNRSTLRVEAATCREVLWGI
jgi:hypothetical protein